MTDRIDELIQDVFGQNGHQPDESQPAPRPRVNIDDEDLAEQTRLCWQVLKDQHIQLYRFGGQLVRIVYEDERVILQPLTVDRLRHELASAAVFVRT